MKQTWQALVLGGVWGALFSPFLLVSYTALCLFLFVLYYQKQDRQNYFSLTQLALLLFVRHLIQFFWVFQTLRKQLTFWHASVWFVLFAVFCSFIFCLLFWIWIQITRQTRLSWKATLLTLPFIAYIESFILFYLPSLHIPSFTLAEQPFVLHLPYIQYLYPILGINVISFIVFYCIVSIVYFPKRTVSFLVIVFMICMSLSWRETPVPKKRLSFLAIRSVSAVQEIDHTHFLLNQLKKYNRKDIDIIIMPETAVSGVIEDKRLIEQFASLLYKRQTLIVGSNKRMISPTQYEYYNSAYLVKNKPFRFIVKNKEYLVPFAEYLPHWGSWLGMALPRKHSYLAGKTKILPLAKLLVGIAICMDSYVPSWYVPYQEKADFYITMQRESDFSNWGKKKLYAAGKAYAWQSGKTVLRWAGEGKSAVFSFSHQPSLLHKYSQVHWEGDLVIIPTIAYYYRWRWFFALCVLLWQGIVLFRILRRKLA